MQSKIPLYPYGAKEARERGELEKWRESFRENCACAGGIDILSRMIMNRYRGMDSRYSKTDGAAGAAPSELYVLLASAASQYAFSAGTSSVAVCQMRSLSIEP